MMELRYTIRYCSQCHKDNKFVYLNDKVSACNVCGYSPDLNAFVTNSVCSNSTAIKDESVKKNIV